MTDQHFQGYESDVSFDGEDDDCHILSPYESESAPSTEDEDPRDVKNVSDAADAEIILRGQAVVARYVCDQLSGIGGRDHH